METEIKELLDEMIQYKESRKPIKYLQRAYNEMGDREIIMPISYLLSWHKKYFFGAGNADKFEIGEIGYKRYSILFENCQELKKVFSVYKDHIGWSSSLSEEEQDEIRNYIHENFTVKIRIRRDMGLNKN